MNYQQTLDYMYSQLPMFQRIGSAAYKDNLDNTIAICKLLNNPETKFKSIHVAGTNGKGSTSHMLASILQSAGYRVGLYTSPHLKDFRERIKINGELIPENYVIDFVSTYKNDFEKIQPSFFEMTVGLAFDYFANSNIDIAVVEVGLGGRLDSTNVITPELSIITNISFDHTALLGNTLEKIAIEKAGIIKKGIPVVIGETHPETKSIFETKSKYASIVFADQLFETKKIHLDNKENFFLEMDVFKNEAMYLEKLQSELLGKYQQKNIPTVLAAIEQLATKGFSITEQHIREGIKTVIRQTGLLGRWQILSTTPLTIADTGHNEAGIKEVLDQIQLTPHQQLHFVIGMVNDKDITTILKMLPKNAIYYFCKAAIPRALPAKELAEQANSIGLNGKTFNSVKEALTTAQNSAKQKDLVFVGGSTFIVAEVV
ncbi:MAG: bifunctional folylpolyglutamate synthase/dihydrofolate synthase [Bacteroidetes bacterium]|nr:bifunctional folylpolyglutamate synthase/dihydrofolate synthase [Bacteroidota bacterium]